MSARFSFNVEHDTAWSGFSTTREHNRTISQKDQFDVHALKRIVHYYAVYLMLYKKASSIRYSLSLKNTGDIYLAPKTPCKRKDTKLIDETTMMVQLPKMTLLPEMEPLMDRLDVLLLPLLHGLVREQKSPR